MATLIERLTSLTNVIGAKIKEMTPKLLPSGGVTGQVLSKTNNSDYAVGWSTVTEGTNNVLIQENFPLSVTEDTLLVKVTPDKTSAGLWLITP